MAVKLPGRQIDLKLTLSINDRGDTQAYVNLNVSVVMANL